MISINELKAFLASRYGNNGLLAVLTRLKERYAEAPESYAEAFSIENMETWSQYKKTVLDTGQIEEYLLGNDSYGTRFLKIIQSYLKDIEKKMKVPEEFDEETTSLVVDCLKEILEKRFTGLLTACYRGIHGDSDDFSEKAFLEGLVKQIEIYLQKIGFKKIYIKEGDDCNKLLDMIEVIVYKPTDRLDLHGKIQEIEIPPYVMKYVNEDNETDNCYLNGRCVIWRAEHENHS